MHNYNINSNEPYGPETWEWIHQGGFYSDVQSGAFRQPNGNTLISDADSGYIFEVTEWARNQAKWKVAEEYCDDRRCKFKIITEDELGIN